MGEAGRGWQTGSLRRSLLQDVLTKSPTHPHGIEVRLESGEVGCVKEILSEEDAGVRIGTA